LSAYRHFGVTVPAHPASGELWDAAS